MSKRIDVIIGIQVRSTSKRFPRKVFETIGGKSVLQHVIDSCRNAAQYINYRSQANGIFVSLALCVPYGDEIRTKFGSRMDIVEGPEDDVLERYRVLQKRFSPAYIVRVTADCPLIPHFLIMKHVTTAVQHEYDYLSNVEDDARTAADGTDCEVISAKMLEWLAATAKEPYDREHVTPLARKAPPEWAKIGHVIGHLNLSQVKLSIDTPDDLERVRAEYDRIQRALDSAERAHGRTSIHRF